MIWNDVHKYASKELAKGITNVADWRPATNMFIDDIVKTFGDVANVPFGIRYWLSNGDSIIYVPNRENIKDY